MVTGMGVGVDASADVVAADATSTPAMHGGTGKGVAVVGHSDLGGAGLNGHVAVLANHAYVGYGTNGLGFQWNKTPKCTEAGTPGGVVKVVSLADPANPTVVATINPAVLSPAAARFTIARDVAALRVSTPLFTGDLLAVALEKCATFGSNVPVGVQFYDVTNPASPQLLGVDDRSGPQSFAVRGVSLVQRPGDGRVFALEAIEGGSMGGIWVTDVTNPRTPAAIGLFAEPNGGSTMECRPFSFAKGVSSNAAGTRAYAAYQDGGLFVLDISDPLQTNPTGILTDLPKVKEHKYAATEEGNSYRFVPNAAETTALATDEDLNPAKTTLTIGSGSATGTYRGCEAIWGGGAPATGPLFRRSTPSITAETIFVSDGLGCATTDYPSAASGKIAIVDRGVCSFDTKARSAEAAGALALLIGNNSADHHTGGGGVLFAPDAVAAVDAGVTIPIVMITQEARNAIVLADPAPTATLADNAETWGALRVFDVSGTGTGMTQVATFNSPHSNVLTPGNGLYHAVNPVWDGTNALVAWMSDGFRVVDVTTPSAPVGRAYYVPPGVSDPTGNYSAVPLVVDVEKHGSNVVISDINGGLYVLNVVKDKEQCKNGGHTKYGFATQGECLEFLGF